MAWTLTGSRDAYVATAGEFLRSRWAEPGCPGQRCRITVVNARGRACIRSPNKQRRVLRGRPAPAHA